MRYPHHGLLAEQSVLQKLGDYFRNGEKSFNPDELIPLLVVFAALGLVAWAINYGAHAAQRFQRKSPTLLFLALCQAHGLGWKSRWRLWRFARAYQLAQPGTLFLTPRLFDNPKLAFWPARHQAELERLRCQIFAGESLESE